MNKLEKEGKATAVLAFHETQASDLLLEGLGRDIYYRKKYEFDFYDLLAESQIIDSLDPINKWSALRLIVEDDGHLLTKYEENTLIRVAKKIERNFLLSNGGE